jgi:hypothetical protein
MAENTIQDTAREAEDVILDLKARGNGRLALTTSQIRKFLAAVNALTNKIDMFRTRGEKSDVLTPELAAEVKFLKVKLAYQAGKDQRGNVRDFVEKAQLRQRLDRIGTSICAYENFARYMEALVAYHKFHGGRD